MAVFRTRFRGGGPCNPSCEPLRIGGVSHGRTTAARPGRDAGRPDPVVFLQQRRGLPDLLAIVAERGPVFQSDFTSGEFVIEATAAKTAKYCVRAIDRACRAGLIHAMGVAFEGMGPEIGRVSCRERVCPYGKIWVVAVA